MPLPGVSLTPKEPVRLTVHVWWGEPTMSAIIAVNWIAVVVARVMRFAIGAGWYAPGVFGRRWQEGGGLQRGPSEMPSALAVQGIGSLVMAWVLAQVIGHYGATGAVDGALVGFLMWLGFVVTIMLPGVMFEKRPMSFFAIYSGYQLVTLVVMGAILGAL